MRTNPPNRRRPHKEELAIAIIPRVNPGDVTRIAPLPGVRNNTQVSSAPVSQLADATRGVQKLATDLYQQHQERNDTTAVMAARRKLSDWEASTFDPGNAEGIGKFKGGNALGAGDALLPDLDRTVDNIDSTLTPRQRAMFGQVSQSFRESVQSRLTQHMTREHEGFLQSEQKSAVTSMIGDAVGAELRGDATTAQRTLAETLAMQGAADRANGYGEESQTAQANQRSLTTAFHAGVLDTLIDRDYEGAERYLALHHEDMDQGEAAKAEAKLRPLSEANEADELARLYLHGGAAETGSDGVPQPRAASDIVAVKRDYRAIAAANGATITSLQRPNIGIGAGAKSQHITGTAADFRTNDLSGEQVSKLMADLRGAGFEVIDERKPQKGSTGPHIHAELPKGGRTGQPASMATASSVGEALARADAITDPRKRRDVKASIRSLHSAMESDRIESERTALEGMRERVANGSGNLQSRLGSDFALAQQQGWLPSLAGMMDDRLVTTDPERLDHWERMRAYTPEEFVKHPVGILADPDLSTSDKEGLIRDIATLKNPKKADQVARWASEEQQLSLAVADMGLAGSKNAAARGEFRKTFYVEKRAFVEKNRREPNADETQGMLNRLKLPFVKSGFLGFGGGTRRAYQGAEEGYRVPDDARAQIIAEAKRNGVANPTDEQIVRRYFDTAGNTP